MYSFQSNYILLSSMFKISNEILLGHKILFNTLINKLLANFGPKKGRIQVGKETAKNRRTKDKEKPIFENAFKDNCST